MKKRCHHTVSPSNWRRGFKPPPKRGTRILIGLGDSQTHIGDFDGAATSLRAAWDLARQRPASPSQARQTAEIARRLGRGYERRGKYDDAMQWLESALREINRDVSSEHAVERARIYLDIGWVHYRRGDLDDAEHWRLRALEISQGLDYYAEMGSAYNGLAALYNLRGDRIRAIEYAERGLQVREMIGDVEGMSRSHSNLGATLLNLGKWDDALPHLERSLEFKKRIGDAKNLAAAYTNLGHYYLYKGDTKRAREYLLMAKRHAERIRDTSMLSYTLNALAQADSEDGNLPQRGAASGAGVATGTGNGDARGAVGKPVDAWRDRVETRRGGTGAEFDDGSAGRGARSRTETGGSERAAFSGRGGTGAAQLSSRRKPLAALAGSV